MKITEVLGIKKHADQDRERETRFTNKVRRIETVTCKKSVCQKYRAEQ